MIAQSTEFENIKVHRCSVLPNLWTHVCRFETMKSRNWKDLWRHTGEIPYMITRVADLPSNSMVRPVRGGVENEYGKVNILLQVTKEHGSCRNHHSNLQTHISHGFIRGFSLMSDCSYVAQNSARLMRGLFDIAIRRGWPVMSSKLLTLCKAIDKQLWPDASPLRQVYVRIPATMY